MTLKFQVPEHLQILSQEGACQVFIPNKNDHFNASYKVRSHPQTDTIPLLARLHHL